MVKDKLFSVESKNIECKETILDKSEKHMKTVVAFANMQGAKLAISNKLIANVFSQMGLVEAWGSGIRRILNKAEEYGLKEPKIEAFDDMFRVNLYRNIGENIGESIGDELEFDVSRLNESQIKILKNLKEDTYLSATKLAEITGISRRNVENNIKKLKDMGVLVRQGSPKYGYWIITKR